MAQKETENNADAKFWGDKRRALWYVVVFSGVVNFGNHVTVRTSVHPYMYATVKCHINSNQQYTQAWQEFMDFHGQGK